MKSYAYLNSDTAEQRTKKWEDWLERIRSMKAPRCFTAEQWTEWVRCASDSSLKSIGPLAANYCTDCLPGFQARMKVEGRCGHQAMVFVRCGPDAFYGRRPTRGKK